MNSFQEGCNDYIPLVYKSNTKRENHSLYSRFNLSTIVESFAASSEAEQQAEFTIGWQRHRNESISNATKIHKVIDEILVILEECSEAGWDGYDARPISKVSVAHALEFIQKLDNSVLLPDFTPEPSGELGMLWEKNSNSLAMSINDKREIAWAELNDTGSGHNTHKFVYDIPATLKMLLLQKYS